MCNHVFNIPLPVDERQRNIIMSFIAHLDQNYSDELQIHDAIIVVAKTETTARAVHEMVILTDPEST
jgi:hypothetical protein